MCVYFFFLLSGNVNAGWYRDNVSRQVVMPFMPRHLLRGWGRGVQHDNAPANTALLTENVLHTNDIYVMEYCHASCYVSHWVCLGYNGLLHEKQGITASKCCITVLKSYPKTE